VNPSFKGQVPLSGGVEKMKKLRYKRAEKGAAKKKKGKKDLPSLKLYFTKKGNR